MEIDKELVKKFLNTPGARQALREGDYDKLFELCGSQKKRSNLAAALYSSNIDFLSKMSNIPEGLFRNCDLLYDIVIPGNIKEIGELAFFGCSNLSTVKIEEGVETIGAGAFSQTKIKEVVLPSTIKKLGEMSFGRAIVLCNFTKEQYDASVEVGDGINYGTGISNTPTVNLVKNANSGEVFKRKG